MSNFFNDRHGMGKAFSLLFADGLTITEAVLAIIVYKNRDNVCTYEILCQTTRYAYSSVYNGCNDMQHFGYFNYSKTKQGTGRTMHLTPTPYLLKLLECTCL